MNPLDDITQVGQSAKKVRSRELRKAVQLTPEAHVLADKASRRLNMSRQDFAGAAIAYFAETGLDPRKVSKSSLAKVENRVVQETFDVRKHNADIGNRLVGIIRTFEKNIGTLVQQQQAGTFQYLETIERNILSYTQAIEENLLTTILERIVGSNVENHMNRVMLQIIGLQLDDKRFPFSEAELADLTTSYDKQRDKQIVVESQKLLESKRVARPHTSVAPSIVELLKAPVPAKPTTGTPVAGAGGTTAPSAAAPGTTTPK